MNRSWQDDILRMQQVAAMMQQAQAPAQAAPQTQPMAQAPMQFPEPQAMPQQQPMYPSQVAAAQQGRFGSEGGPGSYNSGIWGQQQQWDAARDALRMQQLDANRAAQQAGKMNPFSRDFILWGSPKENAQLTGIPGQPRTSPQAYANMEAADRLARQQQTRKPQALLANR